MTCEKARAICTITSKARFNRAWVALKNDERAQFAVDRCVADLVLAYDRPGFGVDTIPKIMTRNFEPFEIRARAHGVDRKTAQEVFGAMVYEVVT